MATEVALEITKKMKDEANKVDEEIRRVTGNIWREWVTLGELGAEVRKKELWRILGFIAEDAYRTDLNIGRSTWYSAIRLIEVLKPALGRQRLLRLSKCNAEQLAKLNGKDLENPHWYEKALELSGEKFESAVERRRTSYNNNGEMTEVENREWLKFRVYESQKKAIEATLAEFAKKNNLDASDRGRVLELLCAEVAAG